MSYKLKWTAELVQTDSSFNPCGASHRFEGFAAIASDTPTVDDVAAATAAMAAEIDARLGLVSEQIAAASTVAPRDEAGAAILDPEAQEAIVAEASVKSEAE